MSLLLNPVTANQAGTQVQFASKNAGHQENNADSFDQAMKHSLSKKENGATDNDKPADKANARPAKRPQSVAAHDVQETPKVSDLGTLASTVDISSLKTSADAQFERAIAAHGKQAKQEFDYAGKNLIPEAYPADKAATLLGLQPTTGNAGAGKNNASSPAAALALLSPRDKAEAATQDASTIASKAIAAADTDALLPKNAAGNGQSGQHKQNDTSDLSSSVVAARDLQASTPKMTEPFNSSLSSSMTASMMQVVPAMPLSINTSADTPVATLAVHPEVGSEKWGAAIGEHISWMSDNQQSSAELHLNPPELGPLKVTLSFTENQAQAHFTSAHMAVRAALEAALPQLRTALQDNGITLSQSSVSPDTQGQPSAFTQNQHGGEHSSASGQQHRQPNRDAFGGDANTTTESPQTVIKRRNLGEIDTFV
ncbi:flagellar hook-length control protein FliK [Glaciimonas soli]|uniref:Flagellar hook-length control protein-like C-terminal domain-containing protein n=1 Tax=Glaciimonas soli TaxID=2590999 RepID=A0A843YPR1_9BURK|nr:flagellar hook-length control protein FliK [Glaciimonas soli]MQQ99447.1 hypothetical protein [Glaciimonas soli]